MSDVRKPTQYRDGHIDGFEPVRPIDLTRIESFSDLLEAYRDTAFGARRLGEACDVFEAMIRDESCGVVMTLSGAMTVAKMSLVICEMIERGYVDAIVSTGALVTHGLVEDTGLSHFKYVDGMDDDELYAKGYNRVYDTLELEGNLDSIAQIFSEMLNTREPAEGPISSREICRRLGDLLLERYPEGRGILLSAAKHDVPVFIPAFSDCEMGLDVDTHNLERERAGRGRLAFDPFLDLRVYADWIRRQERTGIFTIGGGVPRNWGQQAGPYLDYIANTLGDPHPKASRFTYAVRICPEPAHWGGLSGCTYSEGKSWGKFIPEKEGGRFAEVPADATIAWPLLIRALMERVPNRARGSFSDV
jgi:deoxyhypusine synthase